MWYYYLLFFFIALGTKLILAMVTIYLLLPNDRHCSRCDGETLLLRPSRLGRLGAGLFLGRVQWRWCPRCEWQGLARRGEGPSHSSDVPVDDTTPTRTRS